MKIRKIILVLMCFFIASPVISGDVAASAMAQSCAKSGLSGYYTVMSNAVFNMVNIVVENIIGIDIEEAAKTEVPPKTKQEGQKNENQKAVILNNFQKNLQAEVSVSSDFISVEAVLQAIFANIETEVLMQGWFFLLLTAILMCIRKKDANITFYNSALSYKNA